MRITGLSVIALIAQKHGLSMQAMRDPARYRMIARPRQEAMYEVYTRCPHLSYPQIGELFCRDHTTVLHGVRKHCERIGVSYEEAKRIRHRDRALAPHVFEAYGQAMRRAA